MMNNFNHDWQLGRSNLQIGIDQLKQAEPNWIPASIPGDVHQALIQAGRIPEPLEGINSFECEWIEQKKWWFRKRFEIADDPADFDRIELKLDGMDGDAEIFLNGRRLGEHHSAFYPFACDIKNDLNVGQNEVLISLTTGTERITDAMRSRLGGEVVVGDAYDRPRRGTLKRAFLRSPQFSWGWDWSPRIKTICINLPPQIHFYKKAALRDIAVDCQRQNNDVILKIYPAIESFASEPLSAHFQVTVRSPSGKEIAQIEQDLQLDRGPNNTCIQWPLKHPQLWHPLGYGPQDRYTINVEVNVGPKKIASKTIRYGIRFIELDTKDTFCFKINGQKIHCRGANWVPPDAIYSRVSNEQIDMLLNEAINANFNMLRVWGGGIYERAYFYDRCDERGILLWQDFMFACSSYPDDRDDFCELVKKEADHQTRRLRNHCSVILFCGSNECVWAQKKGTDRETDQGEKIYGEILPQAVRRNCPEIPYWYCSPYGGDKHPWPANDPDVGDCHYWELMMSPEMSQRIDYRLYDNARALFVSEFGFPGTCCRMSTQQYLGDQSMDRYSKAWQHHTNYFAVGTLEEAIAKEYIEAGPLRPDQYLYYAGLIQGRFLEYAIDAFRAKGLNNGILFWMYNDAWGEIGWSIVDYYLRRKIAYYFVRRAYQPRRIIVRPSEQTLDIVIINDAPEKISGTAEYGYTSLDGKTRHTEKQDIQIQPYSRTHVQMQLPDGLDPTAGIWFAHMAEVPNIEPAVYRAVEFRKLQAASQKLIYQLNNIPRSEPPYHYEITISSHSFAHAVEFVVPADVTVEDNFFDMLPGGTKTVIIQSPLELSEEHIRIRMING